MKDVIKFATRSACFCLFIFLNRPLLAQVCDIEQRPLSDLVRFEVLQSENPDGSARVIFEAKANVSTAGAVLLSFSDAVKLLEGEEEKPQRDQMEPVLLSKNSIVSKSWRIRFKREGYHLLTTHVGVMQRVEGYTPSQAFSIYVEYRSGKVMSVSSEMPKYTFHVVEREDVLEGRSKPAAIVVDLDSNLIRSKMVGLVSRQREYTNPDGTLSYDIYIYVAGTVRYTETKFGISYQRGVSGVTAYLDWDYDNDPNTRYTPYAFPQPTNHRDYAVADKDGFYYFSILFTGSPYPANHYSNQIRITVSAANSAAFNLDLGNGAMFVDPFAVRDISSATTLVYFSTVDVRADPFNGGALRYLWRAQQFCDAEMGWRPGQIRYKSVGGNSPYFCSDANGSGLCNLGINAPLIAFPSSSPPLQEVGYHEYGHYLQFSRSGLVNGGAPGHYFSQETNSSAAFGEGWAEFVGPAAGLYWYNQDNVTTPEPEEFGDPDVPGISYQFLEYSQGRLITSRNFRFVEGAVACFLYNLYDGHQQRMSGYGGDNEDIKFSGRFILDGLITMYNILGGLNGPNHVEAYYNGLRPNVAVTQLASFDALFYSQIFQSGIPRSATPTSLGVAGTSNSRTLSWNDNTSPPAFQGWTIINNNENGFQVYSKPSTGSWDGTLNGYDYIGAVSQDITSYSDNRTLCGSYSFVVVAYNSGGNSIPKAQVTVTFPPEANPGGTRSSTRNHC